MSDLPLPMIPLSALIAGESAEIHSVVGNSEQVQRLGELGLRAGRRLEMVRQGTTAIIKLEGAKLCFRGEELMRVMVLPDGLARQSA